MADEITVQDVKEACENEGAWRVSEDTARKLLEQNAKRAVPHSTAVGIAREFACGMEERFFQEEQERRDQETEMDAFPDPDSEAAIACGDWP